MGPAKVLIKEKRETTTPYYRTVREERSEEWLGNTYHGHTLGTCSGLQALNRVETLKGGVCEGVDDVEEEIRGNGTKKNN